VIDRPSDFLDFLGKPTVLGDNFVHSSKWKSWSFTTSEVKYDQDSWNFVSVSVVPVCECFRGELQRSAERIGVAIRLNVRAHVQYGLRRHIG